MDPRKLLNDAADVMAKRGHNTKKYFNEDTGGVCAYGALTTVAAGHADYADLGHSSDSYRQRSVIDQAAKLLARHITGGALVSEVEELKIVTEKNDSTDGPEMIRLMKEAASMADIGEENPKVVEFEPMPETAPAPEPSVPAPAPAEPVPA